MLDTEANRVTDAIGRSTEKRMLLLAGLMLADNMTQLEDRFAALEDKVRAAEERTRIAEAKSAMLAANALKHETETSHRINPNEVAQLREEKDAAVALLANLLDEVEALAERAAFRRGLTPPIRRVILQGSPETHRALKTSKPFRIATKSASRIPAAFQPDSSLRNQRVFSGLRSFSPRPALFAPFSRSRRGSSPRRPCRTRRPWPRTAASSSPDSVISVTMSQPPTNSPLT